MYLFGRNRNAAERKGTETPSLKLFTRDRSGTCSTPVDPIYMCWILLQIVLCDPADQSSSVMNRQGRGLVSIHPCRLYELVGSHLRLLPQNETRRQCGPQGQVRARVHGVRVLQHRQAEVRQQLQLQERHDDPEGGDGEPVRAGRGPSNHPGGGHHCVSFVLKHTIVLCGCCGCRPRWWSWCCSRVFSDSSRQAYQLRTAVVRDWCWSQWCYMGVSA